MRSSSGKRAKIPHDDFAFESEVNALPEGLTPKGCLRARVTSIPSRIGAAVSLFSPLCRPRFCLRGSIMVALEH